MELHFLLEKKGRISGVRPIPICVLFMQFYVFFVARKKKVNQAFLFLKIVCSSYLQKYSCTFEIRRAGGLRLARSPNEVLLTKQRRLQRAEMAARDIFTAQWKNFKLQRPSIRPESPMLRHYTFSSRFSTRKNIRPCTYFLDIA